MSRGAGAFGFPEAVEDEEGPGHDGEVDGGFVGVIGEEVADAEDGEDDGGGGPEEGVGLLLHWGP